MPTDQLYNYSITLLVILITGGTALLLSRQRIQAYRASRLLTLLLLCVLLQAVLPLAKAPVAQSLMDGLLLAVAPLFLLHLRSLLGDRLSKGRDGYHFAAFAVWSVLSLFPAQPAVLPTSWHALFPEVFLLIYLAGSYLYLQSRAERLMQIRSRIPMGKIRWAKVSLALLGLFALCSAAADVRTIQAVADSSTLFFALAQAMTVLVALGLAGIGLTPERPVIPVGLKEEAFLQLIADRSDPEPEDIRENATLFKTLDATMQSEKYFFDDDLRLNQLADLMHQPPRAISRAIHHVGGQTFFDYVNGYRALSAQVLIDDPEKQLTLDEVHRASNIESRMVFNKTFKRLTGSAPTAYYKLNNGTKS
ncbi:MAG: helix-turn-helix domain-containing protein [bacterium]|nr:helix-turn-helix domain-containing protein [bacterium]